MHPNIAFEPRRADPDGIVHVGGALSVVNLRRAYRAGVFPWPVPGMPLLWFCPHPRTVLNFHELHISRSLQQLRKKNPYTFTLDRAFGRVIAACARIPRAGEEGTWITPGMIKAYDKLHELGLAHSVEAWEGKRLVGGLYGVCVKGFFSGESMFHTASNASKLALLHLADHLKTRGLDWIDIQVMSPHFQALGAGWMDREAFLRRLEATQQRGLKLFDAP